MCNLNPLHLFMYSSYNDNWLNCNQLSEKIEKMETVVFEINILKRWQIEMIEIYEKKEKFKTEQKALYYL